MFTSDQDTNSQPQLLEKSAGNFDKLPAELVEMIATRLGRSDYGRLRTTCKYITSCTERYFIRENFSTTFETDLSLKSLKSLQKLQDLAKNPELGGAITRLIVSVKKDAYDKYLSERDYGKRTVIPLGGGFEWKRDDKGNLILHQEAVSEWVDIINKLPKCNCIVAGLAPRIEQSDSGFSLTQVDCMRIVLHFLRESKIPITSMCLNTNWVWVTSGTTGVFDKNKFTNCCKFTSACSQLTSLTLTGSGYALEEGRFANLVLAAENLKGLAIHTEIIPDELLEPIAVSAKRPALKELSFSRGMIKDGEYFGKQIMPFLSSMRDSLETIVFHKTRCYAWPHFVRQLTKGGFRALNQVVFDQADLRDPAFVFLCFSRRLARQTEGSATPTGLTYVALSQKEYDDLLKRFNLYVNAVTLDNALFRKVGLSSPKDLIELETTADITRW